MMVVVAVLVVLVMLVMLVGGDYDGYGVDDEDFVMQINWDKSAS